LLTDTNMLRNIRLASLQIAKRFDIELIVKKIGEYPFRWDETPVIFV